MATDGDPVFASRVLGIRPGMPLSVTLATGAEGERIDIDPETKFKVDRLARTLKAYLQASTDLVAGRYSELRDYVPEHVTRACTPTAFLLDDGVIIRYDLVENPETKVFAACLPGSITEWAPRLSESVVYCPREAGFDPGDGGITVSINSRSTEGMVLPIASTRIAVVAPVGDSQLQVVQTVIRPIAITSVNNEFEIVMVCEMVPTEGQRQRQFLVRSRIRPPVGWRTIEVYPQFSSDVWDPRSAGLWAEADLLAAVTRRNLREARYAAIDPHFEGRKRMRELLGQLETCLNGPEEPLHQFVRQHPELLSPTHTMVWSKLPLGPRVTDFVFKEPPTDYLLVELERPSHRLFREDGQPRAELVHATNQVMDWRRYIEDNHETVQRECGLYGISVSPRALVVIGRRASLTSESARKLVAMENAMPRLRILTYDDILTTARAAAENMLGPLWDPSHGAQVYFLPPQ